MPKTANPTNRVTPQSTIFPIPDEPWFFSFGMDRASGNDSAGPGTDAGDTAMFAPQLGQNTAPSGIALPQCVQKDMAQPPPCFAVEHPPGICVLPWKRRCDGPFKIVPTRSI